ncbi:MAG TPA: hypothetical protein VIJ25_00630, partial [Methylococcales bacterium]
MIGTRIFPDNSSDNNATLDSDVYFKDCTILKENCTDVSCIFYNSCDGVQKACTIYDCGTEYGIYIKHSDDKIETKKEAKPDAGAIAIQEDNCKGSMEILEQDCINNKFQAKVKITTKGECKIGSFVLSLQEYGNVQNASEPLGDGVYEVTADRCGTAIKIGPVTENGMFLEF